MDLKPESPTHKNPPCGVESPVNQTLNQIKRTFQSIDLSLKTSPLNSAAASFSMRVLNLQVEKDSSLLDSDRDFLVQLLTGFAVAVVLGKVTPALVQDALRQLKERQ